MPRPLQNASPRVLQDLGGERESVLAHEPIEEPSSTSFSKPSSSNSPSSLSCSSCRTWNLAGAAAVLSRNASTPIAVAAAHSSAISSRRSFASCRTRFDSPLSTYSSARSCFSLRMTLRGCPSLVRRLKEFFVERVVAAVARLLIGWGWGHQFHLASHIHAHKSIKTTHANANNTNPYPSVSLTTQ